LEEGKLNFRCGGANGTHGASLLSEGMELALSLMGLQTGLIQHGTLQAIIAREKRARLWRSFTFFKPCLTLLSLIFCLSCTTNFAISF